MLYNRPRAKSIVVVYRRLFELPSHQSLSIGGFCFNQTGVLKMSKSTIKTIAASALLATIILSGSAGNAADIKPYIGLDYQYITADLGNYSGQSYSLLYADKYQSVAPNIGVKFGDYFGLEAGYTKSLKENKKFTGTFAGFTGSTDIDTQITGYTLDANGYLPVTSDKKLNLVGSVGVGYYEVDTTVKLTITGLGSGVGSGTTDDTALRLGLGAQYNMTDNWGVRAMVRYVPLSVQGVDSLTTYSAGVNYSF